MNITNKSDMQHYLHKIRKEPCHSFCVYRDGSLITNGKENTRKYLAYVRGQWYGGNGETVITPKKAFDFVSGDLCNFSDKGQHLFVISEKRFWMILNDRSVEYASPTKPLENEAVAFLMAEHSSGLCLYLVDGSKHRTALATKIEECTHALDLAATIVIALVREYDEESANQMHSFWFEDSKPLDDRSTNDPSLPWD